MINEKKQIWHKFIDEYVEKLDVEGPKFDKLLDLFNEIKDEDAKTLNLWLDFYISKDLYNYDEITTIMSDIIDGKISYEESLSVLKDVSKSEEESEIEEEPDLDLEEIEEEKIEEEKIEEEKIEEEKIEEDIEEPDLEEEELEEEVNNEKVGFFKKIKNFFNRKKDVNEPDLTESELDSTPDKKESRFKAFLGKFKVNKYKKVRKFINKNFKDNEEIESFMDLLEEREDKEEIINELYDFIKTDYNAKDEDMFIDKLYEVFGIIKEEKNNDTIENKKEEKVEEVKEVKEEKKEIKDITVLNDKYLELKKQLDSQFTKEEIMFIEDAHSEGLELGDQEYDQMLKERCIDKRRVYAYLLNLEKVKLLSMYNNLDDYEKAFIEDTYSENLTKNDQEYDQMALERNINKEVINKYYEVLNESKVRQNKIVEDYKNEFSKISSIDLSNKKVLELKEIAKQNDVKTTSKMKKQELIDALNNLKALKELETEKRLNLIK